MQEHSCSAFLIFTHFLRSHVRLLLWVQNLCEVAFKFSSPTNSTIYFHSSINNKIKGTSIQSSLRVSNFEKWHNISQKCQNIDTKIGKNFWQHSCQKRQKIDKKVIKNCQHKWSNIKQVSTIFATTIWVPRAFTCLARALCVETEFSTDIS